MLHVLDKVAKAEDLAGHGFLTAVLRFALGSGEIREGEEARARARQGKGAGLSAGLRGAKRGFEGA